MGLTQREHKILKLRETKTLEKIGKLFNITKERVRQIEAKAKRKLSRRPPTVWNANTPIIELFWSVRVYNVLAKADINTVGDLMKTTRVQLERLKNLGIIGLTEIEVTKDRLRGSIQPRLECSKCGNKKQFDVMRKILWWNCVTESWEKYKFEEEVLTCRICNNICQDEVV